MSLSLMSLDLVLLKRDCTVADIMRLVTIFVETKSVAKSRLHCI